MSAPVQALPVEALARGFPHATAVRVVDVRRDADFDACGRAIAGSLRRDAATVEAWAGELAGHTVVAVCAHGRAVSQGVCQRLLDQGRDALFLEGGYAAWAAAGQPTISWRPPLSARPSRWVTRERPKIDRIACPWLIRRFLDPLAEFFYVPAPEVLGVAAQAGATPYDVPDVAITHRGALCSFDALLADFELSAPGLIELATIVRGADTNRLDLAPECAGLLAISLGLSHCHADDHAMLEQGMGLYDALYAACRHARGAGHDWNPELIRSQLGKDRRA